MKAGSIPRLLLVTDGGRLESRSLAEVVAEATDAGLRFVQLRERRLGDAQLLDLIGELRGRVPPETWIAVNGRPAVAREAGVGLHVGAAAGPPDLTGIAYWGRSAHDRGELDRAIAQGADYLVLGTLFASRSKPGHPGQGIEWLRRLRPAAADVPLFGIGGIDAARAAEVREAGAYGVAVCGAILEAADPRAATRALLAAVETGADERGTAG